MFEQFDLDSALLGGVENAGFKKPTSIQELVLPVAMAGKDVLASAPTGTGKTAAFILPAAQHLLDYPRKSPGFPRVLILSPTRELAIQTHEQCEKLTALTKIKSAVITGGVNYGSHNDILTSTTDILVATPGRLLEYIENEQFDAREIEILVLDEADRMLDMGFIPQVKQIVRSTPDKENRQTLLFSATFTQDVINLSQQWTLNAGEVEIKPDSVATDTVKQLFYMVSDSEKLEILGRLVKQDDIKHCIIFANRRDQCQWLFKRLQRAGVPVEVLTGEVAQNKRTKTLADFKSGKIRFLIATDVVGRGIHIDGITHVINFNLPQESENYVHRIGRTGRAGASGTSISLIGEEDAYEVAELEGLLGKKISMELPPAELFEA